MSNQYTAVPRQFNDAIAAAKKYYPDSLNETKGIYCDRGHAREYVDGYNSIMYQDRDHDKYVDKIEENKSNGTKFVIENRNMYQDNRFDYFAEYKNGVPVRAAYDQDFDGKYDLVELYDKNGEISQIIEDITSDGKPDIYKFYENGELKKTIDDRSWWNKFIGSFS